MKPALMRTPDISQLFNRKVTYLNHVQKLQKIREDRKQQLVQDQYRTQHLQNIRNSKSRSFAYKFNERNHDINQSNLKFLQKLQHTKPFARHSVFSSSAIVPSPSKQKQDANIRQNNRIFQKIKSISSSLNHDKMVQEYAKTQRIKDRITKYTTNNSRVSLKSEQYLSLNKSKVSTVSPNHSVIRSATQEKVKSKNSLASHYKPHQIMRNRITSKNNPLLMAKKDSRNKRIFPSLESMQSTKNKKNNSQEALFFATEPVKQKSKQNSQPY